MSSFYPRQGSAVVVERGGVFKGSSKTFTRGFGPERVLSFMTMRRQRKPRNDSPTSGVTEPCRRETM